MNSPSSNLVINGDLESLTRVERKRGSAYYLAVISGRSFYLGRRLALALLNVGQSPESCIKDEASSRLLEADPTNPTFDDEVRILVDAGVLASANQAHDSLANRPRKRLHLTMEGTLFKPAFVQRVTRWLRFLYAGPIPYVLTALILGFLGWSIANQPVILIHPYQLVSTVYAQISATHAVMLMAIVLLSAVAHEFGHAAALRYYGQAPGRIGFGVYLVFPVLFSELNKAWALTGKQRAVVSLGGIFGQGIFVAAFNVLAMFSVAPFLAVMQLVLNVSFIMTSIANLNPFLKFDGYWIVSDYLEKPNLATNAQILLDRFAMRLRGHASRQSAGNTNDLTRVDYVYAITKPLCLLVYFSYFTYVSMGTLYEALRLAHKELNALLSGQVIDVTSCLKTFYTLALLTIIFISLWSYVAQFWKRCRPHVQGLVAQHQSAK